ncbi:MAG: hypothetical protein Q4A52_01950, partial [Bacillota bacterium]|nr:hypothetical protein [Bacillota bacterium]
RNLVFNTHAIPQNANALSPIIYTEIVFVNAKIDFGPKFIPFGEISIAFQTRACYTDREEIEG